MGCRRSNCACELRVGETYDAAIRRLCELAPCIERFTELPAVATRLRQAVRWPGSCHTVVIPLSYEVTQQEAAALRPNMQSNGMPAPLVERHGHMVPRFDDGKWVDLAAFLGSGDSPQPLATILTDFKDKVVARKDLWVVATLGNCAPDS